MKPLHEQELESARRVLAEKGHDANAYGFEISFLPPDPDGGGMFTVRYEVAVTGPHNASADYIGGIGLDWVAAFAEDINAGTFGA